MIGCRKTLALALLLTITSVGTAQIDPALVPPPPPAIEPVDPPPPTVALRVRVPAVSAPNAEVQYRILVENTSRAPAHHVIVRNPLPDNVQFVRALPEPTETTPELRWKLGTLEPAARKEIILVVKPTGTGEIRNCARVSFEHGQCVTTRISGTAPTMTPTPGPMPRSVDEGKAELRVRMVGPKQAIVEVGPVIDFATEVTNVGTAVAKAVVLTNKLPEGLDYSTSNPGVTGDKMGLVTWNLGDVAPGQTRKVVCTVIPKVAGKFTNRAETHDAAGHNAETSSSITVGEPKLNIVTTGPKVRLVNRPATYLMTISNPGTMPVSNVVVTSEVTEGIQLVSANPRALMSNPRNRKHYRTNEDETYREVRWSLGTLAAGEKRTLEVVLQTTRPGRLDLRGVATADRNLEQRSEVQTDFEEATGLTQEIEKSANQIEVGGKVTYTISVLNQGEATAKNLAVTVRLPEQLLLVKEKLDPNALVDGQNNVIFKLPALAAKTTAKFVVEVKALTPGEARLRVELTGDPLTAGPIKDEVSTTIFADETAK